MKLWDLIGNVQGDLKKQTEPITGAVISPNGNKILTTFEDNTAKLWDLKGNPLADLNENTAPVLTAAFCYNT